MAVQFSFSSKEILRPGDPIYVTLPKEIEESLLRPRIHVLQRGNRLNVSIRVRGTVAELSTHSLVSGLYTINVDQTVDTKGHVVNPDQASRSFIIRRFAAKVSRELRLEHVVHLAVGELSTQRLRPGEEAPEGTQYLSRVKAVDTNTGIPRNLGFNANGQQVNADEIINAVEERRFAKFGRIDEYLWHQLEQAEESESFEVDIWPMLEFDPSMLREPRQDVKFLNSEKKPQDAFCHARARLISFIRDLGGEVEDFCLDSPLPSFLTKLRASQIRSVAQSEDAGTIFLHSRDRFPNSRSLSTSMSVSRGDRALLLGHTGENINVAVWAEIGPTDLNGLTFAPNGQLITTPTGTDLENFHTRSICGIIKNSEPNQPHGYAPDCNLFNANAATDASFIWATTTNKCTVICTCSHSSTEPKTPTLSSFDMKQDYLTTQPPFPLFINAAGEPKPLPTTPSPDFVNHKAYSALSVGASTLNLAPHPPGSVPVWSTFKNPTSPHSDRELPELIAPGVKITIFAQPATGTSFAAPAVAGVAAVLQSTHSGLLTHPEATRAILLAGTASRNPSGTTWLTQILAGVDSNTGTGPLDAEASVKIAQHYYTPSPRAPPASSGWSNGTVTPPVGFDAVTKLSTVRYSIKTPSNLPPPEDPTPTNPASTQPLTLRATLAWSPKISSVTGTPTLSTATSLLTVNLDLVLFEVGGKKGQVGQSATFDNSYEVIDFEGVEAGKRYELAVRWAGGTDFVFIGVAWGCYYGGRLVG